MKNLIIVCCSLIIIGCNTQYKQLAQSISALPPRKLISKTNNGSSGVTSKIDSLEISYSITSKERLDLILDLDAKLKEQFQNYKRNKSLVNYESVTHRLSELSVENDIKVDVYVKTKVAGAFIRYRTQSTKDSIIADNPTNNCVLNLYLGNYYIWASREGKLTSIPRKYYILRPTSITLEENRK